MKNMAKKYLLNYVILLDINWKKLLNLIKY